MIPDLDRWLPEPTLRVVHERETDAPAERLWDAAQALRLREAGLLGRLIRWRIPGLAGDLAFGELFRGAPFVVLEDTPDALVSGLVGRIWTLRRDYPQLADPEEFRNWSKRGTARVVFANWLEAREGGRVALVSESRVQAFGAQGRLGLRAVRPLVRASHGLVGSDGISTAVRRAEAD
jgi:hypothetical protein